MIYFWHRQASQAKALLVECGLAIPGPCIEIQGPSDLGEDSPAGTLVTYENHADRVPPIIEALARKRGLVTLRLSTINRLQAQRPKNS